MLPTGHIDSNFASFKIHAICERLFSEQDERAGKCYTSARRICWLYVKSDRAAVIQSGRPCANTPACEYVRNGTS